MSERMRIAWTICAIAAVGIAAFIGLRALASGSGQSMRESGLVVPSQSGGAAAQSDPGTTAPPAGPAPPGPGPGGPPPFSFPEYQNSNAKAGSARISATSWRNREPCSPSMIL